MSIRNFLSRLQFGDEYDFLEVDGWEVSAWSRIAHGAGMYPVKRMFVQLDNTTSGRQLWTEADSEAELAWKLTRIMERI